MTRKNDTPNCDMHESLVAYLYGEAEKDESLKFEAHLRECAVCRQELAAFESVRESLQQWQLEALPGVRVVVEPPRQSALALLKELFMIAPVWAKGFGAAAALLLLFAVLGVEVRVGEGGFTMRADLFRSKPTAPTAVDGNGNTVAGAFNDEDLKRLRAELLKEVEYRIDESEKLRQEEVRAQLVSFQEQLRDMRSADFVKLAARVQEHNAKLKTIERDIDRREGMGLSDIIFGEATSAPRDRSGERSGSE